MQKITRYIFIAIILSSIFYAYYSATLFFVFRVLSFVSVFAVYFLIALSFSFSSNKKTKNRFSKNLLVFYLIIISLILIFSIRLNEKDLITLFFHPYSFLAFFIGIVAFLVNKKALQFIKLVSNYSLIVVPLVTVVDLFLFNFPVILVNCYSLILFNCIVSKTRKIRLISGVLLLGCIPIFAIYDYRSGILIISLLFLGFLMVRLFKFVLNTVIRYLFLITSLGLVYFLFFNFTEIFEFLSSQLAIKNVNNIDSRTFLFVDFFTDFKIEDFYTGRGFLGTYFSPYFQEWQGDFGDSFNRFTIEIGFLQMLLKGGFVLVITTVVIFIRAIYLGFIRSNPGSVNFMLSVWLLIEFTMLSIENVPCFNIHFLLIWVVIGKMYLMKPRFKRLN